MILARVLTAIPLIEITEQTGAQIENVAIAYEANPLFKSFVDIKGIKAVMMLIIIPATAMAVYYFFRKRVKEGKMQIDSLCYFTTFAFFVMLMDSINNAITLIGLLL
jgi:hypothetical protein